MERFKLIPAVYLLPIKNGQVLLSRRFQTGYEDGKYSLIAGHAEEGESATVALARETKEEAGIEVDPKNLQLVHVMYQKTNNQYLALFFTAASWHGQVENREPDRCDDLSWFDLDNLPDDTLDYIKKVVQYYQTGQLYSEYGF